MFLSKRASDKMENKNIAIGVTLQAGQVGVTLVPRYYYARSHR